MRCEKCGTVAPNDAIFCSKCANRLVAADPSPVIAAAADAASPTSAPPRKPSLAWLYLAAIAWIGAYAAQLVPALGGQPYPKESAVGLNGVWVFAGLFFYVLWKRRGRKGWHGFLIGALIGFFLMVVAEFLRSYARAHAGAA